MSNSSVVIPGLAFRPTSSIACAAILPECLIFSICSGVLMFEPVNFEGVAFPTYSGLGMEAGTSSFGLMRPGIRFPVFASLGIVPY